ncbi:hypothetical protein [Microbulbifer epialgicus]|uniref:Uncharacterized protein n=1 Tax=Microbulbifer epialgicus TaxID=393907 RepID=A0ABV4NUF3_9GAMM
MSTRSLIVVKTHLNSFRSICVHSLGYPEYQGEILVKYFNNHEKALDLVNLGDLSYVGEGSKTKVLSNGNAFHESSSLEGAILAHPYGKQEYNYYFDGQQWHIEDPHRGSDSPNSFEQLNEALTPCEEGVSYQEYKISKNSKFLAKKVILKFGVYTNNKVNKQSEWSGRYRANLRLVGSIKDSCFRDY